jgi:hypothetical protein
MALSLCVDHHGEEDGGFALRLSSNVTLVAEVLEVAWLWGLSPLCITGVGNSRVIISGIYLKVSELLQAQVGDKFVTTRWTGWRALDPFPAPTGAHPAACSCLL